jgi:hypothetical protein
MPCEISQSLKDKYCESTHMWYSELSNSESESKEVAARGWWEGEVGSYYLMGMEFQFGKLKIFWTWMG